MNILAIESSCDETAAAVIKDGREVLSNIIASQVEIHARYGGVVPEVAARSHIEVVLPVIDEALENIKEVIALCLEDMEAEGEEIHERGGRAARRVRPRGN